MTKLAETMKQQKICAILRGIPSDKMEAVVAALYRGGIRFLEITFNQNSPAKHEETCSAIRLARGLFPDMHVGAGTVMYREDAAAACDAGAEFILAPNVNREVILEGVKRGLLVIAGAMTPSEVAAAYECGSEIVKLFPAGNLDPAYVRSLSAPLNHIPLMAVGAINLQNLRTYLDAGCCCAGIASSLTEKKFIAENDWDALTERARAFMKEAAR